MGLRIKKLRVQVLGLRIEVEGSDVGVWGCGILRFWCHSLRVGGFDSLHKDDGKNLIYPKGQWQVLGRNIICVLP